VLEIEIKAPCPDLDAVEGELLRGGARRVGNLRQTDVYYAHPARDFAATDEALRIRKDEAGRVITYKGPKVDAQTKTREEIEVGLSDADAMARILERLGFRAAVTVSKARTEYEYKGAIVALDTVEDLGTYVEVEIKGQNLEEGRRHVQSLMKELGVEGNERRSYLELLLENRRMRAKKDPHPKGK
jgi:adenylate cyclase class 2